MFLPFGSHTSGIVIDIPYGCDMGNFALLVIVFNDGDIARLVSPGQEPLME